MPPSSGSTFDIEALSGISGSISIACWVVVFSPQIIQNFRRSSADGLSLTFIVIWLLGDVFNIMGAVLQNVLPTMIILAVYYTVADVVLLGQCLYYRGWTLKKTLSGILGAAIKNGEAAEEDSTERSSLLGRDSATNTSSRPRMSDEESPSRTSFYSTHSRLSATIDATVSPATPSIPPPSATANPPAAETLKPRSHIYTFLFNTAALMLVCAAGVVGWWLSSRSSRGDLPQYRRHHDPNHTFDSASSDLHFDIWGQIFGYLCAVLYLGSRIPQFLLNHKRKSTEGVSMLFFIFACVGNLTYVMSIIAYKPQCARLEEVGRANTSRWCEEGEWTDQYGRYILVNTSWLIGSAGTLVLDLMIFGQFWVYRKKS